MNIEIQKKLGAYYTDQAVADFLVSWAIRSPSDKVLDPSYGDGVFLIAADRRLKSIGGTDSNKVVGIDIQSPTISNVSGFHLTTSRLIESDFFKVAPSEIGQMDAVVGNPPFIRYQRFNGNSRESALNICRQLGVYLPRLSSSWAPFLIHSTQFLKPGARLAMVIPAEINHAMYALPVVQYLLEKFRSIRIIAFREQIFPELSQDTFCLLGDDYGERCKELSLLIADNASSLAQIDLYSGTQVDIEALRKGEQRLIEYLLSDEFQKLYHGLIQENCIQRLGNLAEVGIGYVTGANKFFHLSTTEAQSYKIPKALLRRAVRSGRQLQGIRFTYEDWKVSEKSGSKVWLLLIPPYHKQLPGSVCKYLDEGLANKVHEAYKCSVREPWYSVPHVRRGNAFLSYMAGNNTRLVANDAGAVASNTLHVVSLFEKVSISPEILAMLWHTSFTMLSSEIEGHALGGGMLKLEPSEAKRVGIAMPKAMPTKSEMDCLDNMLRVGEFEAALDYADEIVLMRGLGLTRQDCTILRQGYEQLHKWRMR